MDLSWNLNNFSAFLFDRVLSLDSTVCQTTRFPSEVPVKALLLIDWNTDCVSFPTGLLNVFE